MRSTVAQTEGVDYGPLSGLADAAPRWEVSGHAFMHEVREVRGRAEDG